MCRIVLVVVSVLILGTALLLGYVLHYEKCNLPKTDMKGKLVLVTGANAGLGLWSAKLLSEMGAHVVLACRSLEKSKEAIRWIRNNTDSKNLELTPMELELSDLRSILNFGEQFRKKFDKLDVLMNNAGVMRLSGEKRFTKDGFEEYSFIFPAFFFKITNFAEECWE